ncbi:ribonuclease III [Rothia sp. P7181]|uniref:ribonuclease III n=1 Tax=unclassified Rothia (in: high G+C Gram-positive bacteria) TaxID=2689056 RepID=UPI003AE2A2DC
MNNSDSSELLKRLGLNIDTETFQQALVHRSYSFENPGTPHNERLEFLGDSVLSLAIAEDVYRRFPNEPEGELVRRHHVVVSSWALAKVARTLNLGSYLWLGKGEEKTGGADKDSILADTLEAIFGMCYITLGRDRARDLVLELIAPMLDDQEILDAGRDWKTELQEIVQSQKLGDIRYEVSVSGPEHAPEYTATVHIGGTTYDQGVASSKKESERLAAQKTCKELRPN